VEDAMTTRTKSSGSVQLIVLIVIAVVLAAGFFALDRYNAGAKDMLTVETRGLQMISGLTKFRQETGNYPERLDQLVPKFATAVSKCPNGEAIAYRVSGTDYSLSCQGVTFRQQPYGYDSKTRAWGS
jgi:hypothetical protein